MDFKQGKLIGIYHVDKFENRKTGEVYESRDVAQLLETETFDNGDSRFSITDIQIDNPKQWEAFKNKDVFIGGKLSVSNGRKYFNVAKGSVPLPPRS
jgi:hypothetical protein